MNDGSFLQSAETIGCSPALGTGGEIWNMLQNLKEEVTRDLLEEGPLCQSEGDDSPEDKASVANVRDLEWIHRSQLEARLRDITDAQDRLLDGSYGKCGECGNRLSFGRLAADPAASLCVDCQRLVDADQLPRTYVTL